MLRNYRLLCIGLAALAVSGLVGNASLAAPATPAPEAEGIVFERQQIMEQLSRDADTLGDVLAGLQPADRLPEATRAVARGARDSLEAYRQQVPGGRTRPEAWTNHADFMARMEVFVRNADAMAAAGERRDLAAVTGLVVDAMPCKQCHDLYRTPKKPS